MSKYVINFSPLGLDGNTSVLVGRQPYESGRLNELRNEFVETHVFRRDTVDDVIVDIPVVPGQKPIGNIQEEVDLRHHRRLLPPLVAAALIRTFSGSRDILSSRPVGVLGAVSRGLVKHHALPDWIQKRSLVQFETRVMHGTGDAPILGLVLDVRIKNLILGSCAQLMALGVSPLHRYIQVEEKPYDPRLMKRRRLVGRVVAIEGNCLVLEDHADGFETVAATEAFLEARRETFDDCIKRILGNSAAAILGNAANAAAALHAGPGRQAQIEETLKFLREKTSLEPVPGAEITFGSLLSSDDREFPATETIPKPILVFDPSSTRKGDWNEKGLKDNGPYDQRTFSPKQLKIAVICQAKHEGQVDRFVAKFLDGMPDTLIGPRRVARYGDGFLRRFCLDKPRVRFFTSKSAKAEDYVAASRQALAQAADEGFKWNLALVQVEEEFKSTEGELQSLLRDKIRVFETRRSRPECPLGNDVAARRTACILSKSCKPSELRQAWGRSLASGLAADCCS